MTQPDGNGAWSAPKPSQGACYVVKLGGRPLVDPDVLDAVAADLAALHRAGVRLVVIHGGGPQLSEMSERLGLEPKKVHGRRITDDATLRVAKMVFAGEISTDIVAALRRHGVHGVGLSGVDGGLIEARRRAPVRMEDPVTGEVEIVDFENVGDIRDVDVSVLNVLLDGGFIPVVASLGADGEGGVLNINADTIAADLAVSMRAERLVVLSDVPGVLTDVADAGSRIPELTVAEARELLGSGAVTGGMIPKLNGVIRTIEGGISHIHLMDGRAPHALINEINEPGSQGSFITAGVPASVAVGEG